MVVLPQPMPLSPQSKRFGIAVIRLREFVLSKRSQKTKGAGCRRLGDVEWADVRVCTRVKTSIDLFIPLVEPNYQQRHCYGDVKEVGRDY